MLVLISFPKKPEVDDAAEMFVSIATNLSLTGAEIPIGKSSSPHPLHTFSPVADFPPRLWVVDIPLEHLDYPRQGVEIDTCVVARLALRYPSKRS